MIIGIALAIFTLPVTVRACKIPIEAEELCTAAVTNIPTRTPIIGFEKSTNRFVNASTSASGLTASLIVSIPNINTAKPKRLAPMLRLLSRLLASRSTTPMRASMGVKLVGFRSCIKMLLPSSPVRLRSHGVMVVPRFAPIMMPTACMSSISPELTKPIAITVVADEDWITAVTAAPRMRPFIGLEVSFESMAFSLLPAALSREMPMTFIPKMNRESPPIKERISKMLIVRPSVRFFGILPKNPNINDESSKTEKEQPQLKLFPISN